MTPAEALTGLAPIIGGGGVAGIVIAFLAYKTEALKGKKVDTAAVAVGVTQGFVNTRDAEVLVTAATGVDAGLDRLNALGEVALELMFPDAPDIRDRIGKRILQREFEEYRERGRNPQVR